MPGFYAIPFTLLCLLTLSIAAQASPLPENDGATKQVALPDSDVKLISLPSDDPSNADADTTTVVVKSFVSLPLTKINFHPVNRRFPLGSRKGCHHSKVFPTANEKQVISYGNDMIVASGENSDFQKPAVHGDDPSTHHRWAKIHHHNHNEDSDSDSDDEEDKTEKEKKLALKRYHFNGKEKALTKTKSCFFKRLRKFMDHYF